MKYMIFILMLLSSFVSFAEEQIKTDESIKEFSETMGINSLLEGIMVQTRKSLKSSMLNLSNNLKTQYPTLSEKQFAKLTSILNAYSDSIVNSIDINKAAYIYTSVIAAGMSKSEINSANEYYSSAAGKSSLKTISNASNELNEYIMKQIEISQKKALPILTKEIQQFRTEIISEVDKTEE